MNSATQLKCSRNTTSFTLSANGSSARRSSIFTARWRHCSGATSNRHCVRPTLSPRFAWASKSCTAVCRRIGRALNGSPLFRVMCRITCSTMLRIEKDWLVVCNSCIRRLYFLVPENISRMRCTSSTCKHSRLSTRAGRDQQVLFGKCVVAKLKIITLE